MTLVKSERSIGTWAVSVVAIVFGLLTIKSGGAVLFIDCAGREAAGNYVPFVLWFNFCAGFLYLAAGGGLLMQKKWAAKLSIVIAVATIIVFALFGLHVMNDGLYESRTVIAMSIRTLVWTSISIFVYKKFIAK